MKRINKGDLITISYCAGSVQDEDGISRGGKWIDITGYWQPYQGEYGSPEYDSGSLYDENGNSVYRGTVNNNADYNGFPYRNVRIIKRAPEFTLSDADIKRCLEIVSDQSQNPCKILTPDELNYLYAHGLVKTDYSAMRYDDKVKTSDRNFLIIC